MPRILLTVLTTFLWLFMLILFILLISLHTFPAQVHMELQDGAVMLLPEQGIVMF